MAELPDRTLSAADTSVRPRGAAASAGYLVLVMQCERPLAGSLRLSLEAVDEVVLGRGQPRRLEHPGGAGTRIARVHVADPWMSSTHARLLRSGDEWQLADADSKNGTLLNGRPHERGLLRDCDVFEVGHTFFVYRAQGGPSEDLESAEEARAPGLATLVPGLARGFDELAQIAISNVPVVLHGETGTGKEVVARALHALSPRRAGPFVAVNCGALPETLVESELFGYRRGAFSGAVEDRLGLIRSADRGTLLLDELGDLRPPAQAALLRALQDRQVLPLGANAPVGVDFRLMCATHRDLAALIDQGSFRSDLYARVAGFTFTLPALRDRREDLGLLSGALLRRHAGARGEHITVSPDAVRALFRYDWPRNVRELEHSLELAIALAREDHVELAHLPEPVRADAGAAPAGAEVAADTPAELDDERRRELVALLREHGGNVTAVARALGKDRTQIHRWLRRYRIGLDEFRR